MALRHLAFSLGCLTISVVLFPIVSIASDLEKSLLTCLQTINSAQDRTGEEQPISLVDTCPQFYTNFAGSSSKNFLEPLIDQQATLLQLDDLSKFLRTFHHPIEQQGQFDFVGLPDLLDRTLIEETPPKPSWAELFLQWLRQKIGNHQSDDLPWLDDFFEWVQQHKWLGTLMTYGIAGLIVLAAISIVGYQLRSSYTTAWWRKKQGISSLSSNPRSPTQSVQLSWDEVLVLPPNHQPAALLRLVIASFKQKEKLPTNESLTNKEFLEHLRKFAFPQIENFQTLVLTTESVVYGNNPISQTELAKLIHTANSLRRN